MITAELHLGEVFVCKICGFSGGERLVELCESTPPQGKVSRSLKIDTELILGEERFAIRRFFYAPPPVNSFGMPYVEKKERERREREAKRGGASTPPKHHELCVELGQRFVTGLDWVPWRTHDSYRILNRVVWFTHQELLKRLKEQETKKRQIVGMQ